MGEGVTNPVRGAASSSSVHSTAEVVITSLLCADPFETCLHLIVVVSLACAVAAHWVINKRKVAPRTSLELTHSAQKDNLTCNPKHSSHFSCSLEASGGVVDTGLTRKSEPHLRRSVIVCKTGRSVSSLEKASNSKTTSSVLDKCASDHPSNIMDTSGDAPPQPDSFFTWDSGGNSGEYSFVHTAVELPKYPDGAITEEEKQMLLLYMQTGHPELLLSSSQPGNMGPAQGVSDSMLCDPAAAARGFLETIVEENSDDLRSPSECDEASVGWGSWDESDEDRLTVVEMVTSANHSSDASPGPVYTSAEISNHTGIPSDQFLSVGTSPNQSISSFSAGDDSLPDSSNTNINLLDGRKDETNSRVLQCETSVDNSFSIGNCGVSFTDTKTSQECDDVFLESDSESKPIDSDVSRQQGVSPVLNSLASSNVHNSFDTLWISADDLETPSDTQDPWIVNRFLEPNVNADNDLSSLDFTVNRNISKHDESLLFLGTDDICLVPSSISNNIKENDPEALMFSDSFKDYFLPTDHYFPGFNKDDITNLSELAQEPLTISSTDSTVSKGLRCFRIGFEPTPTEQFSISYLDQSMISDNSDKKPHSNNNSDSDSEKPRTESDLQETMFSPVEGDIVYGSSWVSSRPLKEPEKISSGAEVHCSIAQTEVQCGPTMLSESPPPDNNRRAFEQSVSDDETPEVPNSLSRWRHHTDLQHLQEGTSPIARWQHETNLHASEDKQTASEESDDGLPPQLKEIYSSFKMKDNKMGRIRIKEDKNNNFKRLGLWDNESKVTLPPFNLSNATTENLTSKQKESNGGSREELDDLDIDMFAVAKSNDSQKPIANGDSDVDDALRSFNHLDDYTSDENSENENTVNLNEKPENIESEKIVAIPTHNNTDNSNKELTSLSTNILSPENPCSDNSDNCPLCTDPSFKNTRINDIFSLKNNAHVEQDVQSLLQKTYPKMVRLSQSNLSDSETPEFSGSNKAADSMSPLTSSDSDESNRKVKEIKKRVKKRSKENTNTELKHDDSGYVEDDEDDDEEDSLGEKKEKKSSTRTSNPDAISHTRKSLSTAYFESKSLKPENIHPQASNYAIPESFQEFSKQLEQSLSSEELKAGFLEGEKWNIPENLSQFSAWLLDKELKKISTRDEMEKLFVEDIMSLREQTIAKFLKNSCSVEGKIPPKSLDLLYSSGLDKQDSISSKNENLELEISSTSPCKNNNEVSVAESDKINSKPEFSDLPEWDFPVETNNYVSDIKEHSDEIIDIKSSNQNSEIQIEIQSSDDSSSSYREKTDSDNELAEEYFNYNINKQVSKVFDLSNNDQSSVTPRSEEQSITESVEAEIETTLTTPESESTDNIERPSEEKQPQQINTSEAEITHRSEPTITCNKNYERDSSDQEYNGPADIKTNPAEVKPLTDSVEVFNPHEQETETSITHHHPSASEDTLKTQQTKVNDTTIPQMPLTENEEKALPELISPDDPQVLPSIGSAINENIALREETFNDVAPSSEKDESYLNGSEPVGTVFDLMTQGEASEERGVFEGCVVEETDDIGSLQAVAVSFESDRETHVQLDICHAHRQDGTASVISDNSHIASVLDSCSVNNDSGAALHSDGVPRFIDKGNLVEEYCVPEKSVASEPEESGTKVNAEFTTLDCCADDANEVCVTEKENDAVVCLVKPDHPTDEVSEHCSSDDLKVLIEDSIFCENIVIHDKNEHSDLPENNYTGAFDNESNIKENDQQLESALNLNPQEICDNETESNKPDIVSCCEKSTSKVSSTSEIPAFRSEYKRSNSLGRESEEVFEPISTQSKSTPDLRRCHEQLRSSAPLSALLSKSVSQRIQDYLGNNSRSDRLLRSLPPNERSRHYRRICVSTETVVERAARFEARSQSTRPAPRDKSPFKYRSGSCPPSSMKNNSSWISERIYSKPTATVRPTIDTQRYGIYKMSNGDTTQKDSLFEQIAAFTKNSHRNGDIHKISSDDPSPQKENFMELITGYSKATRVTHKPPVPPSATHQSSMKTVRLKGRIASARKDFFEKISQPDLSVSTDSVQKDHSDDEDFTATNGLNRFDEFRRSARAERVRLAASHPDLGALEAAVRSSKRRIDQLKKKSGKKSEAPQQIAPMPSTKELCLPYRRCTGEIAWASCAQRVREATARRKQLQQLEIVDQRDFPEDGAVRAHPGAVAAEEDDDPHSAISGGALEFLGSRARSMDFLLDADNRERALPPENRLASSGGGARVKSEHELRIERSLQNLTIPDWYKQSAWSKKPKEGFILRRGSEGSAGESRKRWQGFSSSRTPSATSLTATPTSYSQRNIVVPKRVTPTTGGDWRHVGSLVSSRESLTPASPASLSPREGTFQYTLSTSSLSRWSSSRLSTSSAPLTALSVHRSFRQPYLGWRAAAASSSGGGSRSSPGISPVNATTPLQGSRPESPRRGSQDHPFVYGLQQNQITSAATLRPDGSETTDSSRISPLALNTTNVFFNSNVEGPDDYDSTTATPNRFASVEMRRDRYSYTQSLYSGTVIVSPGTTDDDRRNYNLDQLISSLDQTDERLRSPHQPPPRIWMESSFVGTRKDGSEPAPNTTRSIRIVPSDSTRAGSSTSGSVRGGTCATQTAMGEYVLRDFRRFGITL
ncbi:uncharacterized protein TNCT_681841 [Trichonephila clavata]|uniref:G protein gamma domain-containing protein n=2 Tax=Trichonephila TaxID=2585208 RepID=A0A8X6LTR1_TRICU|nr:uncharacterized protein TNCT_681841 [Trichonephila clavata]